MVRSFSAGLRWLIVLTCALLALLVAPLAAAAAEPPLISQDTPIDTPVDTLDGVESAVVQIEAVGTFVDPSQGRQQHVPGFGSGFIIDPSGIAVTNNHVVTGGALFKVYVSGRDKPVNARVLGASECYDIAVIDLQGDGYPYLAWYDKPVRVGLDVYAAGFPLGDPEFTLTKGIIAKANANGESSWSSLDSVYMHDATINPGNSGGPLVASDGRVVGVNYASDSDVNQYFAIRGADAQSILEQLRAGEDVESLGINGEAIEMQNGDSAVYVYSVKSGSAADRVGILPGDYIAEIEGLTVGGDGTMTDYCDILASHGPDDVMAVKVYRPSTDEFLAGQFNGRPLETNISIATQVDENTAGNALTTTVAEYTYVPISDTSNIIHIEAPDVWSDVVEGDWTVSGKVRGIQLTASTDLKTFYDSWEVPGVVFSYSPDLQNDMTEAELLDTLDYSDQCKKVGRTPLPDDAYFTGFYDEYNKCGGGDTTALVAALKPKEGAFMLGIEVYATSDADLKALDHILDTFYIGAGGGTTASSDIFSLVNVEGLKYKYQYVQEPYFSALLPAEWTDVNSRDWVSDDGEALGKITEVAPDIQAYRDSWSEPGMQAFLMTDIGPDFSVEAAIDAVDFKDTCTFEERVQDVQHSIYGITYTGMYDVYTRCADSDTIYYTGVYEADTKDHAYIVDLVSATEADDEAFDVLLKSFFLTSAVEPQLNTQEYAPVQDESGRITLQVPVAWTDNTSGPFEIDNETVGIEFTVSTDVAAFNDDWATPGAYVAVWDNFGATDIDEVLDTLTFADDCTLDSRYEYEGEFFAGKYNLWNDCGKVKGATLATFALTSDALPDALVVLYIDTPSPEDLSILDPILSTLRVMPVAPAVPAATPEADVPEVGAATPTVEIVAATLNVRSGPGTQYERIATVDKAMVLMAIGQTNNCAWLKVRDSDGQEGWVSGDAAFTHLNGSCADLPAASAPPATQGSNAAGNAGAQAGSGQACVTFKNQVGIEVNITMTRQGDNWNTTFTINKGQSGTQCVDPGKYTYTAATWDGRSLNGEVNLTPGQRYAIDLNPG